MSATIVTALSDLSLFEIFLFQEKRSLLDQLEETKRGQDETLQEVVSQLKSQQLQDTARINKVSPGNIDKVLKVSIFVTI